MPYSHPQDVADWISASRLGLSIDEYRASKAERARKNSQDDLAAQAKIAGKPLQIDALGEKATDYIDDAKNQGVMDALDRAKNEHQADLIAIKTAPHFTDAQRRDAVERATKKHTQLLSDLTSALKAQVARKSLATARDVSTLEAVTALLHGETVDEQRRRPTAGQRSTRQVAAE